MVVASLLQYIKYLQSIFNTFINLQFIYFVLMNVELCVEHNIYLWSVQQRYIFFKFHFLAQHIAWQCYIVNKMMMINEAAKQTNGQKNKTERRKMSKTISDICRFIELSAKLKQLKCFQFDRYIHLVLFSSSSFFCSEKIKVNKTINVLFSSRLHNWTCEGDIQE